MQAVNFHVTVAHIHSQISIARNIGIQNLIEHLLHQGSHARKTDIVAFAVFVLNDDATALGDIFCVIANAFQHRRNFDCYDNAPQIPRNRCTQGNDLNTALIEIKFHFVEFASRAIISSMF